MSRKGKVSPEIKMKLVEQYLQGKIRCTNAAMEASVDRSSFHQWVMKYLSGGPTALLETSKKTYYPNKTMLSAVHAYLNGEGSQLEICKKFQISSKGPLQNWIKKYNAHKELKSSNGGCRMSNRRHTTAEERLEIVKDCIKNNKDFEATAIKYNVSYQQVRNWIIKYEAMGVTGLEDRRGKRLGTQPSRTHEEEQRDRIAILERKNKDLQMENDLLKKVKELMERDRYR